MISEEKAFETEVWKPVSGYEYYYEISSKGTVRSLKRVVQVKNGLRTINTKILNQRKNNFGYVEVRLSKDSICKTMFVHVLLAKTFLTQPAEKSEVNHINGIKDDNGLENLEWVTHQENVKHAYQLKLIKGKSKSIVDTCSGKEYSSTKEAALEYGINHNTLKNYLNGQIKTNPTCLRYKTAA